MGWEVMSDGNFPYFMWAGPVVTNLFVRSRFHSFVRGADRTVVLSSFCGCTASQAEVTRRVAAGEV